MNSEQQHESGSRAQAPGPGPASSDPISRHVVGARLTTPQADPGKPRCLGLTKQGTPCGGTPTSEGRYCPQHNPKFSKEQRKAWAQRGALALHHKRLVKQRAAVEPQLPPTVALPPVPSPEALDWSDATKCREYIQDLGAKVAAGEIATSIAKTLKELVDSAMRIVEVELDMALAAELIDEEQQPKDSKGRLRPQVVIAP